MPSYHYQQAWGMGLLAIFAAVASLISTVAIAEPRPAYFESVRGEVAITRAGEEMLPRTGGIVLRNDRIETGPAARAAITFPDGSRLFLGAQTEAVIIDYTPELGRQRAVILLEVSRGPIRLLMAQSPIGSAKTATIRGPGGVVVAGPSRTMIDLWTGPVGGGEMAVLAIVGRLQVRNGAGSLVLDRKRQGTRIAGPEDIPGYPMVWPRTDIERALASVE
jgi:hypothetical protein